MSAATGHAPDLAGLVEAIRKTDRLYRREARAADRARIDAVAEAHLRAIREGELEYHRRWSA